MDYTNLQLAPAYYPCWLDKFNLKQAAELTRLGYIYVGDTNYLKINIYDIVPNIVEVPDWTFYWLNWEDCFTVAVCNGAAYSRQLKNEDWDMFEDANFETIEELVILVVNYHAQNLNKFISKQLELQPKQLSLF